MKSKLVILAVVVVVASMVLLGGSDSKALVADAPEAKVSDTAVARNETQVKDLPSATATITITWRTAPNE